MRIDTLKIASLIVTFGPCGRIKLIPATAASLVTALGWFSCFALNINFLVIDFVLVSSVLGYWAVNTYNLEYNSGDAREIVIDEVVGQSLAFGIFYMITPSASIEQLVVASLILFFSFRFFDVIKPWPINLIDEGDGPFYIIFDDVIAGVLSGILTGYIMM